MKEYEFLFSKIQDSSLSGTMPKVSIFLLKDTEGNTDDSFFSKHKMILGSILVMFFIYIN